MHTLKNIAESGVLAVVFTVIVLAVIFAASAIVSFGLVTGLYMTGGNIFAGLLGAIASAIGGMWLINRICS